jgi:hypothetical protein
MSRCFDCACEQTAPAEKTTTIELPIRLALDALIALASVDDYDGTLGELKEILRTRVLALAEAGSTHACLDETVPSTTLTREQTSQLLELWEQNVRHKMSGEQPVFICPTSGSS